MQHAALARHATRSEIDTAWAECLSEFHSAMLTTSGGEPQSRTQALKDPAWAIAGGWYEAELEEMAALEKNGVIEWIRCADLPPGTKVLDNKMIYKDKCPMPGVPGRRKCRCVVRGFQECAHEYGESYAPVCRHETTRAFYYNAVRNRHTLRSVDIRGAFLTAPLERPVYMRAPEGHQRAGYVCRLRRACYGLVDAPRAYFTDFRKFMRELQVMPTHSDVCLYTSKNPKYPTLRVLQYVDDLQLSGLPADIESFVRDLTTKYEIRDYGEPRSFIGMEVVRTGNRIKLTQTKYIEQING